MTTDEQREKDKRISEAASQAQSTQKSGCLIGGIVFVILGGVFGSAVSESGAFIILAIAVVVGIIVAASNNNKTETAVVQAEKQVETVQESRRRAMDTVFSSAERTGFVRSKTVINPTNTACLALDSSNNRFLIKDISGYRILNYNQLVSYELCKDGSSIISGDASGAIMGGLLFGTVGAIAGAAGSSKTVNSYCSDMYISVVDDSAHRYKLPLITETVFESSQDYKVAIERAREMISILSVIDRSNKNQATQNSYTMRSIDTQEKKPYAIERPQTASNVQPRSFDSKAPDMFEEIKKYKELLDLGIITQAEFDSKKAVLLGTSIPQKQYHNDTGATNETAMTPYCVILTDCGPEKMQVMVQLNSILNIEIIEARKMVNNLPSTVARDVSLSRASYIKAQLEAVGATIKVQNKLD